MLLRAPSRFTFCALFLALLASSLPGFAQQSLVVTDFRIAPEWFKPPHEKQMKSLLEGARAQPLPGGRYRITDAKLQTFLEDGQGQIVVAAPECLYDSGLRSLSSAGPLRVRTADGMFSIEGEGFLWLQTNTVLVISNNVHTAISPELIEPRSHSARPNSPAQASGLEILSQRFEFSGNSGLGIYSNDVRVIGTNMAMQAGVLKLQVPVNEQKPASAALQTGNLGAVKLQSITAEQNVVADYETAEGEKVHATGQRALYSVTTGLLRVLGRPAWQSAGRQGGGDEILIDRTNKLFVATGAAWLKLPVQGPGGAGFLPQADLRATNAPPPTNQFVEIRSADYEVRTNLAVFRKDVHVAQFAGPEAKGTMDCGLLTVRFCGTNQVQTMLAEQGVVISQEDKGFTAGKVLYTATNELMQLTDKPAWHAGLRQGRGDRILLKRDEMLVRGNASMLFPAGELAQSGPPGAPSLARSGTATNDFAQIFCSEYTMRREGARFRGGVYFSHPQMNWVCEDLTVDRSPGSDQIQSIAAERRVTFDLLDDKGQVHGTGDKIVYTCNTTGTVTNELIRLMGSPAVLLRTNTAGGKVVAGQQPLSFRNDVIIWDRVNNKLLAPGDFRIRGTAPAVETNRFQLPKNKLFK